MITYHYGHPRRVRKTILGNWWVTNHPAGNRSFVTWRQAMDYAASPYILMNDIPASPPADWNVTPGMNPFLYGNRLSEISGPTYFIGDSFHG